MEKIFNNEKSLGKKLDSKTGRFFIEMPDFNKDANGNYVISDAPIKINTLAGFNDYIAKHQEIVAFLGENYQPLVSTIYKNTLTVLADPSKKSAFSTILSGNKVKNALVYQTAHASEPISVFEGFLRTYNAKNLGFAGEERVLPKVKRTKKQLVNLFETSNEGFFVPEIDKDGLVVNAASSKDEFSVNFEAVPSSDVSYEQLVEYLTAPFGDKAEKSGINFYSVMEKCSEAYKSIGKKDMGEKVQQLVDYCMSVYPYSFAKVKSPRLPVDGGPVILIDMFEPTAPKYRVAFKKVPLSNIKDFRTGGYKYHSDVKKMAVEEIVEKETEKE